MHPPKSNEGYALASGFCMLVYLCVLFFLEESAETSNTRQPQNNLINNKNNNNIQYRCTPRHVFKMLECDTNDV